MAVYSVRRILWESYPILVVAAFISLSAGLILDSQIESIKAIPLILWMIIPLNGINNNVCSILGSRLTSALHMGTVAKFRGDKVLGRNMRATWLMSFGVFWFTSGIFFGVSLIAGMDVFRALLLMFAFFAASMVAIAVTMFCTIALAFISFRKGLDPDNVVIPVVTSIGDVVGVLCLIIAVKLIMGV